MTSHPSKRAILVLVSISFLATIATIVWMLSHPDFYSNNKTNKKNSYVCGTLPEAHNTLDEFENNCRGK